MTDPSLPGPGSPCVLGVTHCTVLNGFNGTSLLWDDMRRTLAFAWELHVFGSASLFLLITVLAVLGMAGACTLPHALWDALTLSNGFLTMAGTLRTTLFLVDPYGTRQILPHATLAALQNVPLQLLLWAQWVPSLRTERLGKRVTAVCAFLGVLCCGLQMYSLLWLYGLLGNWRRFSWGWWLSQFWARILELAWGFSILFLGSWIFWTPSKGHARGNHSQGRDNISKKAERKSFWHTFLAIMQRGPMRKSEKSLEDLMPNNFAKHNMSRSGVGSNAMHDGKHAPSKLDYSSDPVSSGNSCDSQTTLLWQRVGERECVLSLIEFDMKPLSPINLRLSIDNALYHGQHGAGAVFTPPPPSWTQSLSADGESGPTTFPSAYVGYGWMLDTESISASLDHFQAKEPAQCAS
ncbi:proline-rich transmembrane protein 3 [Fundulus diaphanus]